MTPDNWKLVLAFGGLFLTTVTGPILWALRAESRRITAEMAGMRADIRADQALLKADHAELRADVKADHAELRADVKTALIEIKAEMAAMESRLNQRIDTRLEAAC